ncbi:polysaccharide lyase 8 family protein [Streptomyces gamaensis]|uniref:Polysaccharide lyase 8 family protein n=1 Tax=Streptomyces gamaensis TaxID=1763542 RepID=A0ABW0YXD1_9ACTN
MPPARWTRRGFLAVTASALALGADRAAADPRRPTAAGRRPQAAGRAGEFALLRERWRGLLLGTGFDPAAEPFATVLRRTGGLARTHRASMHPAPGSLWPDAPFERSAGITRSCARLYAMAQAYAQPGTGLTGDADLATATATGLAHVGERAYTTTTTRHGNWWDWQIGTPRLLLDTLTLLHGRTGDALREQLLAAIGHFVPDELFDDYSGTSTGANRVDLCRVAALHGILGEDPDRTALARDALSPVFPHVTSGDGLYADGSFVQHTWVAYTGTYGCVLLDGLARLFALLRGSSWEITDPARRTVLDSVERAFVPVLHDGLVMDSVSGRAVSRGLQADDPYGSAQSDHQRGHAVIAAIALLADSAGTAERARWHALVKGWIARATTSPLRTDPRLGTDALARLAAIDAAPGPAAPEPTGHRLLAAMDRAVHRRPGWTVNIAMASERITHYENGNGENPHGWHTGSGMLYWWADGSGGDQYSDAFWPTVDPLRLPGTTVCAKRPADNEGGAWGAPKPAARWVGGVTDGEFAVVGQHLKGLGSTLEARKSWFCAADAVLCLGAGITARDGVPVETVVDNRNLGAAGTAALTVDGRAEPVRDGWTRRYERARWAHLEGHGGYVLPGGAPLAALREARTGAWRDINTGGAPDRLTRRYLTLWHPHGTDPAGAAYACLLLPGADAAATAARAADPGLIVLSNSPSCQAVSFPPLGLTGAAFWTAGSAGGLTVTAPAAVLVRHRGRQAALHLAEPPRTGAAVELVWDRPVRRVLAHDASVRVIEAGRSLRLRVTPGTACASHRCAVELASGAGRPPGG